MSIPFDVCQHRLGNGLRVVVAEDHAAPSVTVHLRYDAGSRHDPPGRGGLAHLVEHLMFAGSRNVAAGEHSRLVQQHGGVLNGITTADAAVYYEHLPASALELALWLEADRMATLPEMLTLELLDAQRAVIAQERHEHDSVLFGGTAERLAELVYPASHAYSRSPLGAAGELAAVTPGEVRDFLAVRYQPASAVLAVTGNVTAAAVLQAAERYFEPVPPGSPAAALPDSVLDPLPASARDDALAAVPFALVAMGWRLPADSVTDPCPLACDLALRIIAAGPASRVGRENAGEGQLVQEAHAAADPHPGGNSLGSIAVTAMPGVPAWQVEDVLAMELESLAAAGPDDGELARARAGLERDALTVLSARPSRAYCLAYCAAAFDDPALVREAVGMIRAVTAGQVQAAAQRWLRPGSAAVVTTSPLPGAATASLPSEE